MIKLTTCHRASCAEIERTLSERVLAQAGEVATLQSELAAAREEIEDARRLFDGDYDINGWLDNRDNEKRLKKVIAEQATAISLIDYLCGEPNDMQVSGYDVHRNEGAVVDRVKNRMAELARAREALIKIADWNGAWGTFPETNPQWAAMAVMTAREIAHKGEEG